VLALDFRGYGQTIAGTQTSDDKSYPDGRRVVVVVDDSDRTNADELL
jgi:hypothetical protein